MSISSSFEQTEFKPITIDDVASMAKSSNYKDRFKAEVYMLQYRHKKLVAMLNAWDSGTLDFTPTCSRALLDKQVEAMTEYLNILYERAVIEKVALPEEIK